jgi:DNA-binding protein H-NS
MSDISALFAQKAELERQILDKQRADKAAAIVRVKELMAQFGLTAADLMLKAAAKSKVSIKYRDASGNTWTGRGIKPRWLSAAIASGKSLDDFLVK